MSSPKDLQSRHAKPRLPELLLPAGSFESGIAAIEGGADALYLGLANFSARKQARNFDALEYRRLCGLARERGVRVYVAINTVILERELGEVGEVLAFLGRFKPDAVIVQDWGLARLVRARCPGLSLHASTQTAAQGAEGVRMARELGASRVVLPRETSAAELARIRSEVPALEYEVFIHGALCYSYSGLCLASGLLLGRSGNRGECAQVCRSYYSASGPITGTGYWFSCRDLCLLDHLGELAAAGATSLKVEGRMKSPEYCYAVARLYRAALDRIGGAEISEEELNARGEAARLAFARSPTEGWLKERGGSRLIDSEYPGHRGLPAGVVVSSARGRLVLDLGSNLGLRDGLLGFERGEASQPLQFGVAELRDAASGRPLVRARAGGRVELGCPGELKAGDTVFRISARELDRRQPSPEEYPPLRTGIPATLRVEGGRLALTISMPRFDGLPGAGRNETIRGEAELKLEPARRPGGFEPALRIFQEAGESDFVLEPALGEEALNAPGAASLRLADAFIPPSALKREKNRFYGEAAALIENEEFMYASETASRPSISATARQPRTEAPARRLLVFPHPSLPAGLPFATERILREGLALPRWDGLGWMPLAPLVRDRPAYAEQVRSRVSRELASGVKLVLGIDALHHVELARELAAAFPAKGGGPEEEQLSFFLDIHMYVANRHALAAFSELAPRLRFAYHYLESDEENRLAVEAGSGQCGLFLAPVGEGFEAPLFLSSGCLLKHHSSGGSCPDNCARVLSASMSDRKRRYRAVVEDCVSMLFRLPAEGGRT